MSNKYYFMAEYDQGHRCNIMSNKNSNKKSNKYYFMAEHDNGRVTGRVKWFNNNRGYGFITAITGDITGVDVFAHHSAISTNNKQYLVEGEYVVFNMVPASSKVYELCETAFPRWEAKNITGF